MSEKAQIDVCFSPFLYPVYEKEGQIVVVIDVLRATSAICTAFKYGVEKMIPVATIEEALAYKQQGYLVGAERNAIAIEGFDFGNSPYSYMTDKIKGQTVVITTTNGTQAIEAAKNAYAVVIGSFLNMTALCDWLVQENKSILLLCSGWKNKFNLEDTLFAGAVVDRLTSDSNNTYNCDSAIGSKHLYNLAKDDLFSFLSTSSHRNRLAKLDLERDIKYCLTLNQCAVIPYMEGKYLVKM